MVNLILLSMACTYGLFIGFLIYAAGHRAWNTLTPIAKLLLVPVMFVFFPADVLFNFIFGSVIFLELPAKLTFTRRCASHLGDSGWRGIVARFICNNFLNPFDPNHCHP